MEIPCPVRLCLHYSRRDSRNCATLFGTSASTSASSTWSQSNLILSLVQPDQGLTLSTRQAHPCKLSQPKKVDFGNHSVILSRWRTVCSHLRVTWDDTHNLTLWDTILLLKLTTMVTDHFWGRIIHIIAIVQTTSNYYNYYADHTTALWYLILRRYYFPLLLLSIHSRLTTQNWLATSKLHYNFCFGFL